MRGLVLAVAAIALCAPSLAQAEACPDTADTKLEKSFGEVRAWLNDDEPVYRPSGMKKLDIPVSYLIVDRSLRWTGDKYEVAGIERLRFRLEGVQRASGGAYPAGLRRDFEREYAGSGCGADETLSCLGGNEAEQRAGHLWSAELSDGDLYLREQAYGPALELVQVDYDMEDAAPAFLVCEYRVDS